MRINGNNAKEHRRIDGARTIEQTSQIANDSETENVYILFALVFRAYLLTFYLVCFFRR